MLTHNVQILSDEQVNLSIVGSGVKKAGGKKVIVLHANKNTVRQLVKQIANTNSHNKIVINIFLQVNGAIIQNSPGAIAIANQAGAQSGQISGGKKPSHA